MRTYTRVHAYGINSMSEQLWDYVNEYVCYVQNRMARKALGDIMPLEALTGDTPDISELFDFVRYFENPEIKLPKP